MASLIWWQFKYSWRKWLGTLFVFVTGGVIAGFTLIGISSLDCIIKVTTQKM
ncbi:hypothetical protein [Lacticaseibacillus rhamnosus]|uniref:hypothetical protein n=1 Tax=Lacticaseibacillus rhamnosus TaxID=47715 RepID=UPI0019525621|nr:hypothetical protein [Lacticaseibacillus rhamnosus]